MTRARSSLCALAVVVVAACGGSGGVSPSPKREPTGGEPPAPPSGVRVASIDHAARTVVIQWDGSAGADRYVAEYWNTFDTSVTLTSVPTVSAETTLTLRDLPGDWLSLRVRAGNAAGLSSPSTPVQFQIPVQKDVVEALFFGTGPYGSGLFAQPGVDTFPVFLEAHHAPETMLGWASDPIRVRAESALSDGQFSYLTRILGHVAEITGGAVRIQIVERTAALPGVFQAGEIHVLVREQLTPWCADSAVGCARQLFLSGGQLIGGLIYVKPNGSPDTVSHEVGHALLGLHHVTRVQVPPRPVMSASAGPSENGFSALEVEAIRAVYGAGLRFGASRADFQARGLIN